MSWESILKIEPYERATAEEFAAEDMEEAREEKGKKRWEEFVESVYMTQEEKKRLPGTEPWRGGKKSPIFYRDYSDLPEDVKQSIDALIEAGKNEPSQRENVINAVMAIWRNFV